MKFEIGQTVTFSMSGQHTGVIVEMKQFALGLILVVAVVGKNGKTRNYKVWDDAVLYIA